MRDNEFTKILGWLGYRVYRHEIDEAARTLRLWVRRKRGKAQRMAVTKTEFIVLQKAA